MKESRFKRYMKKTFGIDVSANIVTEILQIDTKDMIWNVEIHLYNENHKFSEYKRVMTLYKNIWRHNIYQYCIYYEDLIILKLL